MAYSNLYTDMPSEWNGGPRYSVPDLYARDRSVQLGLTPGCGGRPGAFSTRSASQPHNSFSLQPDWSCDTTDFQPCWNIWGSSPPRNHPSAAAIGGHVSPMQSPAPGPASIPSSAIATAPSPPLNATRHSPVLQTAQGPTTSSLWFGKGSSGPAAVSGSQFANSNSITTGNPVTANHAHHVLASPPLSPQSSWELTESISPSKLATLATLSPPKAAPLADGASKELFLDTYFDDLTHHDSLYDPVPAVGELAGVIAPVPTPLYLVKFKNGRTDVYTVSEKTVFPIAVGDLVLVDADRGRDIGKVSAANIPTEQAAFIKWKQYHERQQLLSQCATKDPGSPLTACTPKHILRVAQTGELRQFAAKRAEEQKAVRICNQKVRDRNLDMVIVDAEYQWDHRKLTFFYNANQRVDFRDLVRELFRMYKTRIWMCAVKSS